MLLTQVFFVVPAGIAGTQSPWKASQIHLPVFWIPANPRFALPAGMTAHIGLAEESDFMLLRWAFASLRETFFYF